MHRNEHVRSVVPRSQLKNALGLAKGPRVKKRTTNPIINNHADRVEVQCQVCNRPYAPRRPQGSVSGSCCLQTTWCGFWAGTGAWCVIAMGKSTKSRRGKGGRRSGGKSGGKAAGGGQQLHILKHVSVKRARNAMFQAHPCHCPPLSLSTPMPASGPKHVLRLRLCWVMKKLAMPMRTRC